MKDTLAEDKDGENYGSLSGMGTAGGLTLDRLGRLTQNFKEELELVKEEEMEKFEEAVKNARQPTEDLFGI